MDLRYPVVPPMGRGSVTIRWSSHWGERVPPKAIQQKLDRLDDAFIYKESIDVEGILNFADALRPSDTLWPP